MESKTDTKTDFMSGLVSGLASGLVSRLVSGTVFIVSAEFVQHSGGKHGRVILDAVVDFILIFT